MRTILPVLLIVLSACASTEPLERKIQEQDQELQKLRAAQTTLQADAERARSEARARSAALDLVQARFSPLEKPGRLRLKLNDGRIVVVLPSDVLFPVGKAELSPAGKTELQAVADACAELKDMRYQVEGHTDNVPIGPGIEFGDNWELGSGRAIAVVSLMIARGVDPSRISAASFADTRPVKPNNTEEGRAANRRIEIILVPDLSKVPQFEFLKDGVGPKTSEQKPPETKPEKPADAPKSEKK